MRTVLTSAAISLIATLLMSLAYMFFLGSYTYIPTDAAAQLSGVPLAQHAAWITNHTRVIRGLGYAKFVASDPAMRSAVLYSAFFTFGFGLACAYAGALLQRRSASA